MRENNRVILYNIIIIYILTIFFSYSLGELAKVPIVISNDSRNQIAR